MPEDQEVQPTPQLYTLGVNEFTTPLQESPAPYMSGDTVTRARFINFYIDSFAKSRGVPEVQKGYMEWLQANRGFDYITTLQNLYAAGGGLCLSTEELVLFMQATKAVTAHAILVGSADLGTVRERKEKLENWDINDIRTIFTTDLADKIPLPESINDPKSQINTPSFPPKETLKGMLWETFLKKSQAYIATHRLTHPIQIKNEQTDNR